MNPADLLAAINQETRKINPAHLSQTWYLERSDYGGSGRTLVSQVWERLLCKMPQWLRDNCIEENIYVGEWFSPSSFSANVRKTNDGWLIAIPSGLTMAIYQVSRSIASWLPGISENQPKSEDDARSEIRSALSWLTTPNVGFVLPLGGDISPARIKYADVLTTFAEWFVICHELSHIFFNHLSLTRNDITNGMWLAHSLVGSLRFFSNPSGEPDTSLPHAKEFAADERGLEFLMACNFVPGEDTVEPSVRLAMKEEHAKITWAGAALYLLVSGIVCELTDDTNASTHPFWMDRHTNLQNQLVRNAPDLEHIWLGSHHGAVAHILHPLINWAHNNERSARPRDAADRFSSMLDVAARCATPNYSIAILETFGLLESEQGPDVCLRLRDEWKRVSQMFMGNPKNEELIHQDMLRNIVAPNELSEIDSTHWRIELRKFKLLVSLARRLPPHLTAFLNMPNPW